MYMYMFVIHYAENVWTDNHQILHVNSSDIQQHDVKNKQDIRY